MGGKGRRSREPENRPEETECTCRICEKGLTEWPRDYEHVLAEIQHAKTTGKIAPGNVDVTPHYLGKLEQQLSRGNPILPTEFEGWSELELEFYSRFGRKPRSREAEVFEELYQTLGYYPSEGEMEAARG